MLNFVKRAFRVTFVIFLWINAIGSAIGGAVWGYIIGSGGGMWRDPEVVWIIVGTVVGMVLGAAVGLLSNILLGGLIAIFIDIGNDVSDIKAANTRIQADIAALKGAAADIKSSTADTAAVFQKMAGRQAAAGGQA